MAYYIATNYGPKDEVKRYSSSMLHEAKTKAELVYLEDHYDRVDKVSGAEAHRWVKDGFPHSTALYCDYDWNHKLVVRKATEENDR